MPGKYASATDVPADRTQGQISETLRRYGATAFAYGWESTQALVEFRAHERHIRFLLPLPDSRDDEFRLTPAARRERSAREQQAAYEQAVRQRWRALLLVIKAKLEAVETGIVEFEAEFMAHIVMPDGRTVAEHVLPRVEEAYQSGAMPPRLLPGLDYYDTPREIEP